MKTFIGTVKSAKMDKTVVVEVVTFRQHPLYLKRYKFTKRFLAHDPLGAKEGDKVQIKESRPISRRKRWQVSQIIN
jgi:small subunit ribosomal protein S17